MASQQQFQIGDVVSLRSGGPSMTVQAVPAAVDEFVMCVWFPTQQSEPVTYTFPPQTLELEKKASG